MAKKTIFFLNKLKQSEDISVNLELLYNLNLWDLPSYGQVNNSIQQNQPINIIILSITSMDSFLFENEQIDCTCFQNNQQTIRKIFKPQSSISASDLYKVTSQSSAPFQKSKLDLNKKSLKKQKPLYNSSLEKNTQQNKDIIGQDTAERVGFSEKNIKILSGTWEYQKIDIPKFQAFENDKEKLHSKQIKQVSTVQTNKASRIRGNLTSSLGKVGNSQHLVQEKQYEKLVQEEFKKDLYQFQIKFKPNQIKPQNSQRDMILNTPIKKSQYLEQPKQETMTEQQIRQLQRFIETQTNPNYNNKRRKIQALQKIQPLQKIDSISSIYQQLQPHRHKSNHQNVESFHPKQRKQTYRHTAVSCTEKSIMSKKLRNKIYPKEIQSEKDASSNSSDDDKISEVVGRGWDRLTEQKRQLEELEQMMNNKKKEHTQTMVTQQSHIKNSEIKTLTEYSNSLISPKSQGKHSVSMGFGHPRYGVTGMSYQNIDELKKKRSLHGYFQL